ncbi:MAG: hypothetical protein O4861_20445 [Trichodesmium sp. St16_bin4-tuft]|nr:hypothetical protein [Trichodesmium sp. St5_bin8]MDE5078045.1 hypothetical protein [Trichodesmium sp. St2_bin6]MDE5100573.1 hypothetical protein [Trichodesmium sp. St16_bin4-tuft]MDE5104193.1 hypothetical protein [Trichodesmium sp. St19_bin2]
MSKYEDDLEQSEVHEGDIVQVSADGANDQHKCYEKASQLAVKGTILPGKDVVIWQHSNFQETPHPRDENLRQDKASGTSMDGNVKFVTIAFLISNNYVRTKNDIGREVITTTTEMFKQ